MLATQGGQITTHGLRFFETHPRQKQKRHECQQNDQGPPANSAMQRSAWRGGVVSLVGAIPLRSSCFSIQIALYALTARWGSTPVLSNSTSNSSIAATTSDITGFGFAAPPDCTRVAILLLVIRAKLGWWFGKAVKLCFGRARSWQDAGSGFLRIAWSSYCVPARSEFFTAACHSSSRLYAHHQIQGIKYILSTNACGYWLFCLHALTRKANFMQNDKLPPCAVERSR